MMSKISIEQWHDPHRSLKDNAEALSSPELKIDDIETDIRILNTVITFLLEYCELPVSGDIRENIEKIHKIIQAVFSRNTPISLTEKSDRFALQCLIDIPALAALFKEIMFIDQFDDEKFLLTVADLGSGSGILLLAGIIAARRTRIQDITAFGFDLSKKAVSESRRILTPLMRENETLQISQRDIVYDSQVYEILRSTKPEIIISETIATGIPPIQIDPQARTILIPEPYEAAVLANKHSDPFPLVMSNLLDSMNNFYTDVQARRVALFPNIINGDLVAELENARLKLHTCGSKHISLPEIGNEWKEKYEIPSFGYRRWPTLEELKSAFVRQMLPNTFV